MTRQLNPITLTSEQIEELQVKYPPGVPFKDVEEFQDFLSSQANILLLQVFLCGPGFFLRGPDDES